MPSVFSTTRPKKFNFQQSYMRQSFHGDDLVSLYRQTIPPHPLPQDTSHGTATPYRELTQLKTRKLTIENKRWGEEELLFGQKRDGFFHVATSGGGGNRGLQKTQL